LDHLALHSFPTRRSSDLERNRKIESLMFRREIFTTFTSFSTSRADCGPVPRILCAIAPVCLQFPGLDHAAASYILISTFSSRGQDRKSTRLNSSHQYISY